MAERDYIRVTVTLRGERRQMIEQLAAASMKKPGDIVGDLVYEVLDSLMPVLQAGDTEQARRVLFKSALSKLVDLVDEDFK